MIDPEFFLPKLSTSEERASAKFEISALVLEAVEKTPKPERAFDDRPWMASVPSLPSKAEGLFDAKDRKAVPEPASLMLLLTGCAGLLARRQLRSAAAPRD